MPGNSPLPQLGSLNANDGMRFAFPPYGLTALRELKTDS